MIRVVLYMRQGHYAGFAINGHANAGPAGQDIVCAAVSSVAYYVANTATDLLGGCVAQAEENYLQLQVEQTGEQTDLLLKGFAKHIQALEQQYPQKIKLLFRAG